MILLVETSNFPSSAEHPVIKQVRANKLFIEHVYGLLDNAIQEFSLA